MNEENINHIAITLDIDWAPDFVIDFVAEKLLAQKVRATWFVTHQSPAVGRLRRYPELFELGIHPNFLPGSTHGDQPEVILRHCLELVPEATSIRTHSLVQSTPLLSLIASQTPIKTDVSLYLPHTPNLRPVEFSWKGKTLLRIPFFWEDDLEMERDQPLWRLTPILGLGPGLKIFNFHPIHIYLNSADDLAYQRLKEAKSFEITPPGVAPYIHKSEGTQTLFMELIKYLADSGNLLRICDLDRLWRQQSG
jgi:hypothetical protein